MIWVCSNISDHNKNWQILENLEPFCLMFSGTSLNQKSVINVQHIFKFLISYPWFHSSRKSEQQCSNPCQQVQILTVVLWSKYATLHEDIYKGF